MGVTLEFVDNICPSLSTNLRELQTQNVARYLRGFKWYYTTEMEDKGAGEGDRIRSSEFTMSVSAIWWNIHMQAKKNKLVDSNVSI